MSRNTQVLRDGLAKCREALRGEILPHEVDAWEVWETVSELGGDLSEPEDHILYARLMKSLVATIRLQCEWLRYEADELYVDSDIARERVASLPLSRLLSIFLGCFHPLLELEEINEKALEMGREHWLDLSTEGDSEGMDIPPSEFRTYDRNDEVARSVFSDIDFDEVLNSLESEFTSRIEGSGIEYDEFVSEQGRLNFNDAVRRSYLSSFLLSQGRLELVDNQGGPKLVKNTNGRKGDTHSLAIVLRRLREDN